MQQSIEQTVEHVTKAVFHPKLVQNNYRGILVEAIVDLHLGGGWRWCSGDWAPHDFEHESSIRLEVKQSAAVQSWQSSSIPKPSFDIARRQMAYVDDAWSMERPTRAEIYVFAYHGVMDRSVADHRDPAQWTFFPVLSSFLPSSKRIGLGPVTRLTAAATAPELGKAVDCLLAQLTTSTNATA